MTPYIFDAADDMKAVEEFGRYEKHKLDRDKLAIHEPKLMRLSVPTPVPIALPERLPV